MITIGIAVKQFNLVERIKCKNLIMLLVLFIFGIEVIFVQIYSLARDYNMYASFVILVPTLLVWIMTRKPNAIIQKYSNNFAQMSLDIYIFHWFFAITIDKLSNIILNIDIKSEFSYVYYGVAITLSIVIPYLIRNYVIPKLWNLKENKRYLVKA